MRIIVNLKYDRDIHVTAKFTQKNFTRLQINFFVESIIIIMFFLCSTSGNEGRLTLSDCRIVEVGDLHYRYVTVTNMMVRIIVITLKLFHDSFEVLISFRCFHLRFVAIIMFFSKQGEHFVD